MNYGLILSLLIALPCMAQTKETKESKTSGPCSPAISGNNNRVIMDCQTVTDGMLEAPAFREKAGNIVITVGGNTMDFAVAVFRSGPVYPLGLGQYRPITLKLVKEKLLFSFRLWSKEGSPPVEVDDNEIKLNVPGWDWNYTANALEIVNENGIPVFQMIKKGPRRLTFNGVFFGPGGVLLLSDNGLKFVGDPVVVPITKLPKPIFKYPAWKYPGKFADGSN